MAAPSYTYTLTNGTTADASQVQQNFNDIRNGVSDGTKDLSILGLAVGASLTIADNTTLGSASGDDVTWNASLASSIPVKTTASFNVGSSTLGLLSVYLGRNAQTVRLIASASMSATWTLTLPVAAGTANYALLTDGSGVTSWTEVCNVTGTQTIGGAKTWSAVAVFSAGVTLSTYSVRTAATDYSTSISSAADVVSSTISSSVITTSVLSITNAAGNWNLHGFASATQSAGTEIFIQNDTAFVMTVIHNSGTEGTFPNKIFCPAAANVGIGSGGIAKFVYLKSRWRMV